MSKKAFRWEYAVLSAILTFAALSLAYYSFDQLGVRRPLERALAEDPDVKTVDFETRSGSMLLVITLEKTSDLSATYARVLTLAREKLGESFEIEIKDGRNRRLDDAYYAVHHLVEEASVRGNFGEMMESCKGILAGMGLADYRITVQRDYVFIQMFDGDAYLYEVAPTAGHRGGIGS